MNYYQRKNQGPNKIYQNLWMALYDVTESQLLHVTHKNHIGLVKNGFSLSEQLNKHWLKKTLPVNVKTPNQTWPDYIAGLTDDTSFVVWASENEITGELLMSEKTIDEIHALLAAKRIISIQISHSFASEAAPGPYSVYILRDSIFMDGSVNVRSGEKYRATSILADYQFLNNNLNKEIANRVMSKAKPTLSADYSNSYFSMFSSFVGRLDDRYVFLFRDINAAAIKEDLKMTDNDCFTAAELPFWILDLFKNWWPEASDEHLLRGILVITNDAVDKDRDIFSKISNSADNIRRLGIFSVL